MLSKKFSTGFSRASEVAKNGTMKNQLGAVLWSCGKIVSSGKNSHRSKLGSTISPSIHAEVACLHNFSSNSRRYRRCREKRKKGLPEGFPEKRISKGDPQ
jgi:deoxycytidylate deaminase